MSSGDVLEKQEGYFKTRTVLESTFLRWRLHRQEQKLISPLGDMRIVKFMQIHDYTQVECRAFFERRI